MIETAKSLPTKRIYLILILGLLTAIGPLSIDMYLPAFPDIAKGLHTSVDRVMLSLSSFFIGISAGQLIYGPMLERYGRKKPLYVGLFIYMLTSVGCAMVSSVDALIAFRFLQALGGCAGMVAARAIVRDLFEAKQMAKVFSTLMLVVAVSPIIAPTLGGYITALFGWRWVFAVLASVNLFILAGVFFLLPESKKPDPGFSLKPVPITKSFVGVIKHPQFFTYAFTGAISASGLYAYISGSPYVFMELFGVSEKTYGWIFALVAIGIIGATQVNNIVLKYYSSEQIIKMASTLQACIATLFAILAFMGWVNIYTTILLVFMIVSCQGFIFPNSSALSLAPFAHNAGTASALMGAIQMGIGAGTSALVSILQSHSAFPMAGVMAVFAIATFSVFTWGRKIIQYRASMDEMKEQDVEMISTL